MTRVSRKAEWFVPTNGKLQIVKGALAKNPTRSAYDLSFAYDVPYDIVREWGKLGLISLTIYSGKNAALKRKPLL